MTVWYPMPRRLASRLAQVRACGCRRMETGAYRSRECFCGRPLLGTWMPNLRSIARRICSRSSSVKCLPLEKSNPASLRIIGPFSLSRLPSRNDPVQIRLGFDKNYNHKSGSTFTKYFLTPLHSGMFGIWKKDRPRIVKDMQGLFKWYSMLRLVGGGLSWIPFKPHHYCMYRKSGCQA